MGVWGIQPWESDGAADWFADFFADFDMDERLATAFQYEDDYEAIRAGCYILDVLGRTYIWPGDLDRLDEHLATGISLLSAMLEPDSEFLDLWENDPEVSALVEERLAHLRERTRPAEDEEES